MSCVYRRVLGDGAYLFVVGHYSPAGDWEPESDHATKEEAAARVSYLNGGRPPHATTPHVLAEHLKDFGRAVAECAALGLPCCQQLAHTLRAYGYDLPAVDVEPDHTT